MMMELGVHMEKYKADSLLYITKKNKFQIDQRSKWEHMRVFSQSWGQAVNVLSIEKKMNTLGHIQTEIFLHH